MTRAEIDVLEHASRTAMVSHFEDRTGEVHYRKVLAAMLPAFGILAAAAAFLFVAF